MQTKNSNRNLCQKYIVLCKLKTVRETCVIKMQTENSNRNLSKTYIVLCKLKTVTETCLKNKLHYAK